MPLSEFNKEQTLRIIQIKDQLNRAAPDQYHELVQTAVQIAHEHFFNVRFDSFEGDDMAIIYSNMGGNNAMARDRFRRELRERGVEELAVAAWPRSGEDAGYSWALLIDTPESGDWVDLAQKCWSEENT
jgi:hypothetical protein